MRVQTIEIKADAVFGSLDRGHETVLLTWGLSTKKILTIMLRSIFTSYYCQYNKYITVGFFNLTIYTLCVGAKCFLYYINDNSDIFGLLLKCHINTSVGNFCSLTKKMTTFYCEISYLFLKSFLCGKTTFISYI